MMVARYRRQALPRAVPLLAEWLPQADQNAVRTLVVYLWEGRVEGMLEGQVGTIESLLRAGVRWPVIEAATGIDQDALRTLRQRLEGSEEGTKEAD